MNLGLKIALPIFIVSLTILGTFSYLLYFVNIQAKSVFKEAGKFRESTLLNQELLREQEVTEYNIISYIFSKDPTSLSNIAESDNKKDLAVVRIQNLDFNPENIALIQEYNKARQDITMKRNALLAAIQEGDNIEIQRKYADWNSQTNEIRKNIRALEINNSEYFQNVTNSFNFIRDRIIFVIVFLTIFLLLSIYLLFYWLNTRVSKPVTWLSQAATQISSNNFSLPETDNILKSENDEIGVLWKAMVSMSENLKGSYEELEEKVASRTKQLISEKKQLLENKATDVAILESIGDALVVLDTSGRITFINQAFQRITGWSEEESVGKIFTELIPCEDEAGNLIPSEERYTTRIVGGFEPEEEFTKTVYYKRKDDTRFPVTSLVKRVVLYGKTIGAVKTFSDITKTTNIDNAKTEFVSLAAHQLRTPISAIGWYTEMLLSGDAGELNPNQRKFLNQIYDANQRMISMVKSFLSVSRIEMGDVIINKESIDIMELINNVVDEQKVKLDEKEIAFDMKSDIHLTKIALDVSKIRMVFQNLLSNAIKYTEKRGKISIDIKKLDNKNELMITISDTGCGIPESDQNQIFTKLFRAKNIQEMAIDGTGLGLYVAKNFIDSSGGKIWFESKENVGTKFYLTLPL